MKIGYIVRYDLTLNPHLTERFKFREATFTRRITSRGDPKEYNPWYKGFNC